VPGRRGMRSPGRSQEPASSLTTAIAALPCLHKPMSSADDLESPHAHPARSTGQPLVESPVRFLPHTSGACGRAPRVLRRVAGSEDQRRTRPQRSPRRTDCHADASAPGSLGGPAKEPAAWPANPPVSKHHHSRGSFLLSGRCRRPIRQRGMAEIVAALVHGSTLYATTIAAGLLMVRLGSIMRQVESKDRARWCASCHRRISGRSCRCSREP